MKLYHNDRYFEILFTLTGSCIPKVFWRALFIGGLSGSFAAWLESESCLPPHKCRFGHDLGPIFVPEKSHTAPFNTYFGIFVGLLLVFKTNSAFNRIDSAQALIGGLTHNCRTIASQACAYIAGADKDGARQLHEDICRISLLMMVQVIKRLMHLDGSGADGADPSAAETGHARRRASSLIDRRTGCLEDAKHIPETHAEELERFERALAQGHGGHKMRGISVSGKVSGAGNKQHDRGPASEGMDLSNFHDLADSMCWFGDIGHRTGQHKSASEKFCCGTFDQHVFMKSRVNDSHIPVLALWLRQKLQQAFAENRISAPMQTRIDVTVDGFLAQYQALRKIKTVPIPFPYSHMVKLSVFLYLVSAPFFMVSDFQWFTPVLSFLLSLVLLGIDEIAVEIEDPFGEDPNDIDLMSGLRQMDVDISTLLYNMHGDTPAQRSRARNNGSMLGYPDDDDNGHSQNTHNVGGDNPAYSMQRRSVEMTSTSTSSSTPLNKGNAVS